MRLAWQSLMYMHLGLWLVVLTALGGSDVTSLTLGHFFSSGSMSIKFAGGWISIIAFFLNALAGAFFLCVVVERAKKCLDFTATYYFMHLCGCALYDGFPEGWEWWIVMVVNLIVMSLLGEYLCMRREMREIPLFTR